MIDLTKVERDLRTAFQLNNEILEPVADKGWSRFIQNMFLVPEVRHHCQDQGLELDPVFHERQD